MKKIISVTSLILTIMLIVSFSTNKIYSLDLEFSNGTLNESYYLGETIVIPDAKINVDGTKIDTTKYLYDPLGHAYSYKEVKVNQLGQYRVEYIGKLNNKTYKEEVTFIVNPKTLEVSGLDSNVSYELDKTVYNTGHSGLQVKLSRGDYFRYNDIVDLSKLGVNDPFIELFVQPTAGIGNKDARKLIIELIDIYDESNSIRIIGNSVDDDGGTDKWWQNNFYIQAGIGQGSTSGIEWFRNQVHTNTDWGFPESFSMYGIQNGNSTVGKKPLALYYDQNLKQLFGTSNRANNYIIDLDDTTVFSKPFKGFTTGEVYVKVSADTYTASHFQFMITKLGKNDLSRNANDTMGPRISIDYQGFNKENLPKGLVGQSYPVFSATAMDSFTKKANVSVRVFRNYYSSQRYEYNIIDNRFKTDKLGTYYIEYTSYDGYKNKTVEIVQIEVLNSANEVDIAVNSNDVVKNTVVGTRIDIASYDVLSNGVGNYKVNIFAELNGQKELLNNYFRPSKSGKYKIVYQIIDFIGQTKEVNYEVNVSETLDPVFTEDVVLPKYIIANYTYEIPNLNAFDYVKGETVKSKVFVTDGTNTQKEITNGTHSFTVSPSGNVTITYKAESETGQKSISYNIPIIRTYNQGMDMTKYFYSDDVIASAETRQINLNVISGRPNATIDFINPLQAYDFNIRFKINSNSSNFKYLEYVLEDKLIKEENLVIRFEKQQSKVVLYVNGVLTPFDGFSFNNEEILMKYNNANKTISINDKTPFIINGKNFNGFSSNSVYLTTNIKQITGNAALSITQINGQTLSNDKEDFVRPTILIDGVFKSIYKKDSIGTIFSALSFDVLSPSINASVSVKTPSNNFAKDVNGKEIKDLSVLNSYDINLSEYGSYLVTYLLDDNNGSGQTRFTYIIYVEDDVKPVINIDASNPTDVKINQNVTFSKATSNDNVDGDIKVFYYIITPGKQFIALNQNSLNYTFTKTGIYTLRYFSIDAAGNMQTLDVKINVGA